MDLTDTWVEWYFYTKQVKNLLKRDPSFLTMTCGLCEGPVRLDDDFEIYSSALEVIDNSIDDGPGTRADPDGLLGPKYRRVRVVDKKIICLTCLAARLPALAQWVTDYRKLRATRDALIASDH